MAYEKVCKKTEEINTDECFFRYFCERRVFIVNNMTYG